MRGSRLPMPPAAAGPRRRRHGLRLLLAVFVSAFARSKCKDISNQDILVGKFINNGAEKYSTLLSNEILDNKDDDDFYLGYSGYLRSSSSMLVPRTSSYNSSDNNTESTNDNSLKPKVDTHRRLKRGVTHLYNMIVCATGCNPLAYKGYGCYCGFLGSGYPMDGIDRCCKMHDWCYNASECPMFVEYFVPYYWKCYRGYKPICAIEHGDWGGSGSCAQRLCECDRSFAECLRRFRCPRHKAVCTSSPWRLIQNIFMII